MSIKIKITGLKEVTLRLKEAPQKYYNNTNRAIDRSLLKIQTEAIKNAPVGQSGDLRRNIKKTMGNLAGKVSADTDYSAVIDQGRKAGKGAPPEAIQKWVAWKFRISDPKKVRSVAFLVNRKIKQHGIKGTKFFENAIVSSVPFIEKEFNKIFDDII